MNYISKKRLIQDLNESSSKILFYLNKFAAFNHITTIPNVCQ